MGTSKMLDPPIKPRIILHGGAEPGATALDVATHAVSLLEDNPLFNCGKGAVFTRAGTIELESSIMVSNGYRKRGVGCMTLKSVKNPIKLAREMLIRGEQDNGGGAQAHSQLSGEYLDELAKKWGMETAPPEYFFTQRRWDEHIRGLESEHKSRKGDKYQSPARTTTVQQSNGDPSWDGLEYLPQGTVGAVVLDSFGTVCAATSTGGLTNKLPGRIGDTPTLGAGFWAEEWIEELSQPRRMIYNQAANQAHALTDFFSRGSLGDVIATCLPLINGTNLTRRESLSEKPKSKQIRHAVAMSGTGNGDSFLRVNAVRTCAAISRFSHWSLSDAVKQIAGSFGELQKSAGNRWGKTGEGEGGIIGIELVGVKSSIVWDFNCGGMFRAWIDERGEHKFMVFKNEY